MNPKVSIIILNWNGIKDTEECLNSLRNINYNNYEIIVVDNGSTDDSIKHIKSRFPEVILICNPKNYGFAEGNNIGIRIAIKNSADYVLLLNNDTVVDSNLITELIKTANSRDDIAIVSPKIYNYYDQKRIESAGFILKTLQSKSVPIGYNEIDIGEYNSDREISFASGCVMLIKAKYIVSDIFDPYYFAYCEDVEFCHKTIKEGKKIYYSNKSEVWHKVSSSTGGYKSPLSVYLFTKNRIKFVERNLPIMNRLFFYIYMLIYSPAFICLNLLQGEKKIVKRFIRAILSTIFNKYKDLNFEFVPYYSTIGINARYLQRSMSGIERYTFELIKNISIMNNFNKYVLFFNQHEPLMSFANKPNFINYVTSIPTKIRILRIFWEQFWLFREIRYNNVDLFHGPSFLTPVNKVCKYIITIHDLSFFKYPESFTLENKLYFKFFLKRSIVNSDRIIADSQSTKKDILRYFGIEDKKVKVIYLGVDDKYKKIESSLKLNQVRKKYSLPDKFIMFTGVLSPRKNLERTFEAFYQLKKENIPHKFVIVGKKGWLYQTIFDRIKQLNLEKEIIFTDYVDEDDLPYLYNLASALVLVSLYEGFGLPVLEAMACGCPVLTSKTSSLPEVAGDASILVNPLSVEEIKNGMKEILFDDSLRNTLIKKGFEQVKKFSWIKTAEETLKTYEELLKGAHDN